MTIKLIVGLGNNIGGLHYFNTRHNFGSNYVRFLAKRYQVILHKNDILCGYTGILKLNNEIVHLLIPDSYMNNSGLATSRCVDLYELYPEEILIAHDDLDLLPGNIRIKLGNRMNDSHHGIKDIVVRLHNKFNFYRLRIGIGRPNMKTKIVNFVLSPPSDHETKIINYAINKAILYTEDIIINNFIKVMNHLHSYKHDCL